MLDGFKQPIFGGSIEDGTFDVVGYVDPDRATCKSVQADPDSYLESAKMENFVSEFGFYPQQCLPQSGVLEHEADDPFPSSRRIWFKRIRQRRDASGCGACARSRGDSAFASAPKRGVFR